MIPQARPDLGAAERAVLLATFDKGQLAQGPELETFELEFGQFLGQEAVVACTSGFAALHLALLSLQLPPGGEVITPCVSTCSAVRDVIFAAGLVPVFADLMEEEPNLDAEAVRSVLSSRTVAILCPHHFGIPAPVERLAELGLPILEDCAQAPGASLHGKRVGNWGQLSAFSFYPTKLLASVDGGAVAGLDRQALERARDLRYYGGKIDNHPRLNYKMAHLHAALARVQLARFPDLMEQRRQNRECFRALLPAAVTLSPVEGEIAFRLGLKAPSRQATRALQESLSQHQVPARPEYQPLCDLKGFPRGRRWVEQFLSVPCYSALTPPEVQCISQGLSRVFAQGGQGW